jgi:hypothetical protein
MPLLRRQIHNLLNTLAQYQVNRREILKYLTQERGYGRLFQMILDSLSFCRSTYHQVNSLLFSYSIFSEIG